LKLSNLGLVTSKVSIFLLIACIGIILKFAILFNICESRKEFNGKFAFKRGRKTII